MDKRGTEGFFDAILFLLIITVAFCLVLTACLALVRTEEVATIRKVTFYNDTAATIPDAAINNLKSYPQKVILLIIQGIFESIDHESIHSHPSAHIMLLMEGSPV